MSQIKITQTDLIDGRYFKQGETYDYIGEEIQSSGCGCNGSRKEWNTYVVLIDNKKYNVMTKRAEVIQ
jgi:hypothetical protein